MRKILGVTVLMLSLCCPAFAGEIPNPPAPQPQGVTTSEPPADDDPATGDEPDTPIVPDGFAETLLDLLAILPTLL